MIISHSALLKHFASFMLVPGQPRLIELSGCAAATYGNYDAIVAEGAVSAAP